MQFQKHNRLPINILRHLDMMCKIEYLWSTEANEATFTIIEAQAYLTLFGEYISFTTATLMFACPSFFNRRQVASVVTPYWFFKNVLAWPFLFILIQRTFFRWWWSPSFEPTCRPSRMHQRKCKSQFETCRLWYLWPGQMKIVCISSVQKPNYSL